MTYLFRALVAAAAFAAPACLSAAPATEMIFDESVAADLPVGTVLRYDYEKIVPEQPEAEADPGAEVVTGFDEGTIVWTLIEGPEGGRGVEILLGRDGREVELPVMPTSGGNPLVVVFLEQVARSVSGLTGGSPFYIRNRMKEALLIDRPETDAEVPVEETGAEVPSLTLTPLAGDPNAEEMRGFDALEVTFTYRDEVPGGIYALEAELLNDDGVAVYREGMSFQSAEMPQ